MKIINKKNRAVLQYNLDGELVNEHASLTMAAKKVNRSTAQGIWLCCNNKAKTHAHYIWKYKPEEITYAKIIKHMPKTISKNFYDFEIKGVLEIDGKKVLYLKNNVVRQRYADFSNDDNVEHLNQQLINAQRLERFYKEIMGIDDFENN